MPGDKKYKSFFYSSGFLLLFLVLLKLSVTCFSVFIYAKFSPFLDAERYLSATLNSWDFSLLFDRTLFTDFVYAALKHVLGWDLLVHLFVSAALSFVLWYVLKSEYRYLNKPLLLGCLLLPHFLIWTGVVGKEALAIAGFLLLVKVCVDLVVWNQLKLVALFIGLFISLIERPHYALAYIYLLAMAFVISKSQLKLMSLFLPNKSFILLVTATLFLGVIYFYLKPLSYSKLNEIMIYCQSAFLNSIQCKTNRWDILWENPSDFFYNAYWGIPMSLIGPTLSEAVARPVLYPVFIEGCFCFILLLVLLYHLVQLIKASSSYSSFIIWGFLPALVLGLLVNYPFGIFNTGSAIRYKQSLSPLLYFFPLILMGAIRRKNGMIMPLKFKVVKV
jgi:hypothetical protein